MKTFASTMLSALLLLCACATASVSDCARERAAVENQIQEWKAAAAARDADRLSRLYAENAVVMYPGLPRVDGRDTIRQLWAQFFGAVDVSISPTSVEMSLACDMATELGTYVVRSRGANAQVVDSGKYVFIWKRTEEGWRGVVDITSSDRRAAAAGAQAN